MNIVLLSGGSGKRLWPLSNETRSKQFIKLFKTNSDKYESMIQRVYRQICKIDSDANVIFATSKDQVFSIHKQIGSGAMVSIEPCRRDTFPAIVLSALYLVDVMKIDIKESVVFCPVDIYAENDFFETIRELEDIIKKTKENIILIGVEPTYPAEKYGYIVPVKKAELSKVDMFKEKPSEEEAKEYIDRGALWNTGVFGFKLQYIIDKAHEMFNFDDYYDFYNKYGENPKISFDYAVLEKESHIEALRFCGTWRDMGTWNTFSDSMEELTLGNGVQDEKCENVHIVNELDIPIVALGLKNVVISATQDGILVSDKERSSHMKPYVESISQLSRVGETEWGEYKIVDIDKESTTVKIKLNSGTKMQYHSHRKHDEVWIIVSGKGKTTIDGISQIVSSGDIISMEAGCEHTIKAISDLEIIEVRLGNESRLEDKKISKKEEVI